MLCASDGELWGHHKKFADLTLAFATRVEAARRGIEVDEPGRVPGAPPADLGGAARRGAGRRGDRLELRARAGPLAARLRLQHGRRRTRATRSGAGRCAQALDIIRDAAAAFYEDAAGDLFGDPWAARDAYGEVVDDPPEARDRALAKFARAGAGRRAARRALAARRLLELQRATLLMYASCGWFFDDIAGLEGALVIRMGAHALDSAARASGAGRRRRRCWTVLAEARSNRPEQGTGADVFRRVVRGSRHRRARGRGRGAGRRGRGAAGERRLGRQLSPAPRKAAGGRA